MNLFSLASNAALTLLKQSLNSRVKPYGVIDALEKKDAAGLIRATFTPRGETQSVTLDARLEIDEDGASVRVTETHADREWIQALLQNFAAQKTFAIPSTHRDAARKLRMLLRA